MNATGVRIRFSQMQLGPFTLQHRLVMAPVARLPSVQPRAAVTLLQNEKAAGCCKLEEGGG